MHIVKYCLVPKILFSGVTAYLSIINKQPELRLFPKILDEKYDLVMWTQGEGKGK